MTARRWNGAEAVWPDSAPSGVATAKSRAKSLHTGEWIIGHTNAEQRSVMNYWLTILWVTRAPVLWIVLRHALWFVGFMSLYAIWITHPAGWAAETPSRTKTSPRRLRPCGKPLCDADVAEGNSKSGQAVRPRARSYSIDRDLAIGGSKSLRSSPISWPYCA